MNTDPSTITPPTDSGLTVADALAIYHKRDLPDWSTDMAPLSAETLDALRKVEGYTGPRMLAGQLTAALRVLWVARKSGELNDEDADDTLWLLHEVSSLLEHAIEAHGNAVWWQGEHEKAKARADQEKAGRCRRSAKGAA